MIPYEDLVAALQMWRVKQGLPVGTMSPAMPSSSTTPLLGSRSIPGSPAPARTAPPAPPPSARPSPPGPPPKSPTPPPLAPPPDSESIDEAVDDGALLEETHYEAEGADYALSFDGGHAADGEHEGTTVDDPSGTPIRQKPPRDHDW